MAVVIKNYLLMFNKAKTSSSVCVCDLLVSLNLNVKVVEQSQLEDPLALNIATMIMSRPGSVMDDR